MAALIEKLKAVDRTQTVARAYDLGLLRANRFMYWNQTLQIDAFFEVT